MLSKSCMRQSVQHSQPKNVCALYKQATVLTFDEATSQLGSVTEETNLQTIEGLNQELTILLIAHSLTNLKNCI